MRCPNPHPPTRLGLRAATAHPRADQCGDKNTEGTEPYNRRAPLADFVQFNLHANHKEQKNNRQGHKPIQRKTGIYGQMKERCKKIGRQRAEHSRTKDYACQEFSQYNWQIEFLHQFTKQARQA